jgi:uncharacterized membrane protein YidH (DUF202 family)
MVFLNVALVGLILGKVLGGRLSALADTQIAGKGLAFVAIGVQLVAFPLDFLPWTTPSSVSRSLWLVSFALLIVVLLLNRALPGVAILALGLACNLVAVTANHGLMPVRSTALQAAGTHYHVHNNSIQVGHPNLAFLIDRWAVPGWVPMGNVFSVGDVLIAIGTVVAIAAAMKPELVTRARSRRRDRTASPPREAVS